MVEKKVESKVVSGTGVSVNSIDKDASRKIQVAMEDAIKDAHKAGITDPHDIRKRMREAHLAAKGPIN